MHMSTVSPSIDLSPVRLSYVAALRGVKPRVPDTSFAYAQYAPGNIGNLICLAASNPEGCFYGILPDGACVEKAQKQTLERQVNNITFMEGSLTSGSSLNVSLPPLEYLVCEDIEASLSEAEREALYILAEKKLKPNGLLAFRYRAYANMDQALRFLVSEFAPEMNVDQAKEFLQELKALGPIYFADKPLILAALDRAIASGIPDEFFLSLDQSPAAESGTFDAMAGLLPHGFAFAGDADVGANYMELVTPATAHPILENCREHLLYEPIKDFAMQRLERNDIWCRLPADQSDNEAVLFGGFTYGITTPRDQVPLEITAHGKTIDLRQKPFVKLIELMTTLPMSIGDFLQHPSGQGVSSADAVTAIQILVATGVARPMRSGYPGLVEAELTRPKWAAGYNRYLDKNPITSNKVQLASSVVGNPVTVSARDALVMQAISRAGMEESVAALLPELYRVSQDPALAAQIMDIAEPTPEMAHNMIQDVVGKSIVRWYAYGLLAA